MLSHKLKENPEIQSTDVKNLKKWGLEEEAFLREAVSGAVHCLDARL